MTNTTTAHWAIIVGVNYYAKDKCLQGSVKDAKTVQHYLEKAAAPVDIVTLTATTPPDPSSSRPTEEPECWPTYENVVSSLRRVLDIAQPGDFFYFHYSGHGTKTRSSDLSRPDSTGELALVLFEDNENGSRYLYGRHLAGALHKMVEKGVVVTLVLDCCFSGSVVRTDDWRGFDIRYANYNPDIDGLVSEEHRASLFDRVSASRDSHIETDWLINPDGYTILSACGPYETAYEVEIQGEGRRGALTHLLCATLSALRKSGTTVTNQSLHEHLRTRFHSSWPQQTPMRYGNKYLSFFGELITPPNSAFVSVYWTESGRLRLRAGIAHGFNVGDEFALYPFHASERALDQAKEELLTLKIKTVENLESDLGEAGSAPALKQVMTGWKAKLLTCVSPQKIRIRLAANIDSTRQWKDAAERLRFLQLCVGDEGGEPCIFNIVVNRCKEYAIVDALYTEVVGLPTIPLDSDGAMDMVMDVLQHLAIFKFFERLENRQPQTTFCQSFSITPDFAPEASGTFNVNHHCKWGFTIDNSSDKPLYMAIFNFNPSWGIVNLVSVSGGDDYWVVPPRTEENNGKREAKMFMEVPDFLKDQGRSQCEDVIKVFITSKPTSFPTMVLPKISLDKGRLSNHTRGNDDLSIFLSEIEGRYRGDQNDIMEGNWATQSFIIRTSIASVSG